MEKHDPREVIDALLDKGIHHKTHHATLRKAFKDVVGAAPNKDALPGIRTALKIVEQERRAATAVHQAEPEQATFKHIVDPHKLVRPKVAVLGFVKHREEAFALGDDWEVWGINELHRHHKPNLFTRWYEIHPITDFYEQDGHKGDPAHLETLAQYPIPVYMHEHYDDIPASVPFPRQEIIDHFNAMGVQGDYQTSSISWELAHALYLGAEEVGVFGVDMANNEEYVTQRPCLEYWIGIATILTGKEVQVPDTSDLLTAFGQYGFPDMGNEMRVMMEARLAWLHQQHNDRNQLLRRLEAEFKEKHTALKYEEREFMGGIQNMSYILRSWMGSKMSLPESGPTPDRSKDPKTGILGAAPAPSSAAFSPDTIVDFGKSGNVAEELAELCPAPLTPTPFEGDEDDGGKQDG